MVPEVPSEFEKRERPESEFELVPDSDDSVVSLVPWYRRRALCEWSEPDYLARFLRI